MAALRLTVDTDGNIPRLGEPLEPYTKLAHQHLSPPYFHDRPGSSLHSLQISKTPFDKMAYRPQKDGLGYDQSDHDSVSLAGIIKLQSDPMEGSRFWRPQYDVKGPGSTASFHSDAAERKQDESAPSTRSLLFDGPGTESSTFSQTLSTRTQSGNAYNGTMAAECSATSGQASNGNDHPNEVHYTTVRTQVPLFGDLPDPIRLSEQTGEFDGQVTFIGHPNRDVSAHQWSSTSFEWVNVGRYTSSRGKVEGSLASDRLRWTEEPQETLEYFKLAAENRQTLVVEHGRPKECNAAVEVGLRVGADVVATPRKYKDSPSCDTRLFPPGLDLPATAPHVFAKLSLEDPFVAATPGSTSQRPDGKDVQGNWAGSAGSLDLTYRSPSSLDKGLTYSSGTLSFKNTESSAPGRLHKPVLQAVADDEGAATQHEASSTTNEILQQLRLNTAYQRFQGSAQLFGNNETSGSVLSTRPAVPVASTTSALNATALPYARIVTTEAKPGALRLNATVNAAPASLYYSDPDGSRTAQPHEVANGLNHQAPTPQTFEGPFFTESKPTAHDPTVALSVRVSEEEKLEKWFHDGQRPARQKEYTKSLIAAAAACDARQLGAIGEGFARENGGPYANTAPFVRLYENLSEYVEESRKGGDRSYFTRGWKHANPQPRDTGVDSSAGYVSKRNSRPCWPKMPFLRSSERSMWG